MFCAVSGLNFTHILVQRLLRINMQFMRFVYESFSMSGFMFSFLMMPVMLGFAVLMIVSNLALLRHESFRVQNILGLGIGLALIGGEAFGIWAGLAGLRAEGLGSKTKWWFWPNAFVRECIGLLANRALPELIWLIILVVLFGGIATQVIW